MGSLLTAELHHFSARYRLSPREHDVVLALASGLARMHDLAAHLRLSHNTLHNHLQRIFRKTGTAGKAEVLSLVLRNVLQRQAAEHWPCHPKVWIVDDEPRLGAALRRSLERRGMDVDYEPDPRRVLKRLTEGDDAEEAARTAGSVDVLVLDIEMPEMSGLELLRRIRELHGPKPSVFVMTGEPSFTSEQCLAQGADAYFRKPVDIDALAFRIFEEFVESPYERSRFVRVEAAVPVKVDGEVDLATADIGYGGAYIPLAAEPDQAPPRFEVGQRLQLELCLEGERQALRIEGEVAWRREAHRPLDRSGMGIRFVGLPDSSQASIEAFVRRRKLVALRPEGQSRSRISA